MFIPKAKTKLEIHIYIGRIPRWSKFQTILYNFLIKGMANSKKVVLWLWKPFNCIPWPPKHNFWHQICHSSYNRSKDMGFCKLLGAILEKRHLFPIPRVISLVSLDKSFSITLRYQRGPLHRNLKSKVT